MVKRAEKGREESDLDRIQDLFPGDQLMLHERDPLSPRKGLMRSKSSAAIKLQRALPGKSKIINGDMPCSPSRPEVLQKRQHLWGDDNFRVFIMESPVNFTMGMQKQDRHLFLFNDLLLVAKPKSGGSYKLKDKVRLGELWLSQCLGDVCEAIKSPATSFVIGWPTTNVVVSFNSLKTKDLWQQKFLQLIEECKEREGTIQTSIQIAYRSQNNNQELFKTIKVDNRITAQECIKLFLQQLGYPDNCLKDYKLWVKSKSDAPPYPLIGHEYPFSIKMNFIRSLLQRSDLDLQNLNNISTDSKCYFILRRNSLNSSFRIDSAFDKKHKKVRRPQPKFNWPFKKMASKNDSVDSGNSSPPPHNLFGLPLWKLCPDNAIPKPVMSMLVQLFQQGPYTVGIFRKSANARACRELKEKLEVDPECDLSNVSVIVLSSVFKEFLRSLPDCLLHSDLYKQWLHCISFDSHWESKKRVLSLLSQLPLQNIRLLQFTLCLLWHISRNASENKMSSTNLAVCIGPSLLNPGKFHSPMLQQEDMAERVPKTVAFLIDHCAELFGSQVLQLLGTLPERDRQDSGAEESDSLHSMHDMPGQYRRDDSSIDSLDRDFLDEIEPSPKMPAKTKMSLTNLSRDSGLTLSDTQLYTPEEELPDSELSDGGRTAASRYLAKSTPHLPDAGNDTCYGKSLVDPTSTVSYGKNVGISIDGSCPEVVRKRRQEAQRTKSVAGVTHQQREFAPYEGHVPLQLSQSYSYSMQQDLLHHHHKGCDPFVRNYHVPVRRRDIRGRSAIPRPIVSAIEPMKEYSEGTLRRSASEESLMQKYSTSTPSPISQNKRRAPSPPSQKGTVLAPTSSQKDQNHNHTNWSWFNRHSSRADFKRSQSTSKIDEIDQAHDSSTLSLVSSEDSTPHVSRSSSRVQELSTKSHSDLYSLYATPQRVNSICSSTSDGSHQSHCSQTSSKSQRSNNGSIGPPSYQETINRQTLFKHLHGSPTIVQVTPVTEEMRAEQTSLSAKARELYENSVRMYTQQAPGDAKDTHRALPVSVDTIDGHRGRMEAIRRDSAEHSNRMENYHLNVRATKSIPVTQESSGCRLRHLPPVHVTDAQLNSLRNFHIRHSRDVLPVELRKEINWSVAQLREKFCSAFEQSYAAESSTPKKSARPGRRFNQQPTHVRSRSLSSRAEEESFV